MSTPPWIPLNRQASQLSWFDVVGLPITTDEPDPPKGLTQAVSAVHKRIDSLVAQGMKPHHVLLGGFSQVRVRGTVPGGKGLLKSADACSPLLREVRSRSQRG